MDPIAFTQSFINPGRTQSSKEKIHLSRDELKAYKLAAHPDKNSELSDAENNCFTNHLKLFRGTKNNEITINDSKFCINFIKKTLKPYWKQKKEEKKEFDDLYKHKLELKNSHIKNLERVDICKTTFKKIANIIHLIQESNKGILELHEKYKIEPNANFSSTITDILSEHTKLNDGCEHTHDEL